MYSYLGRYPNTMIPNDIRSTPDMDKVLLEVFVNINPHRGPVNKKIHYGVKIT